MSRDPVFPVSELYQSIKAPAGGQIKIHLLQSKNSGEQPVPYDRADVRRITTVELRSGLIAINPQWVPTEFERYWYIYHRLYASGLQIEVLDKTGNVLENWILLIMDDAVILHTPDDEDISFEEDLSY